MHLLIEKNVFIDHLVNLQDKSKKQMSTSGQYSPHDTSWNLEML
jgi:hypothetical protein